MQRAMLNNLSAAVCRKHPYEPTKTCLDEEDYFLQRSDACPKRATPGNLR